MAENKKGGGFGRANADTVWKVGLYIRLSREDGKAESESVANQRLILDRYMETEFEGRYVIIDRYVDDGLTGTDDAREAFARLNRDVACGCVDCVVVKTLARCFRNYADQGYYLEYFYPLHRVRFISLSDPSVDTLKNPEAVTGMELPIHGLMNDRFAAATSSAVRRTFRMKRERGAYIGAFAPYGLQKDPADKNRLVLDPAVVPVKRDMLRWVLRDGMSLRGVALRLNELGVPNPTAYKKSLGLSYHNPQAAINDGRWSAVTVRRVLLNEINVGRLIQGRRRVISYKVHETETVPPDEWFVADGIVEPVFTEDEYAALQRALTRGIRTPEGGRHALLFAGFLRCADCGKAMQRKPQSERAYYVCRTYSEKSKTACSRHSIREDALAEAALAFLRAVIAVFAPPSALSGEGETGGPDQDAARYDGMARAREKELLALRDTSDGLYDDLKRDVITLDEYGRLKDKYALRIRQCEAAIRNIAEARSAACGARPAAESAGVAQLDRCLLGGTVNCVFIHEDRRVRLSVRFADGLPTAFGMPEA